jgi:predicted phage tail protein
VRCGMNNASAEDRSLGALISGLFQDLRLLFTQEMNLAKRELEQKVSAVSNSAINIAIGAVLALGGTFVLLAALVLVLDLFMPAWVAALVVAFVFLFVGGLILFIGVQKLRMMKYVPERTIRTVEDGARMVKERLT